MLTETYRITTAKALRAEFWRMFPHLSRKKIKNFSGNGTMYTTDVRCAWTDFKDDLSKSGDISQEMYQNTTL